MGNQRSLRAISISGLLLFVLGGAVGVASAQSDCTAGQTSAAFSFTGAAQTFTVPGGVTSVVVIAKGAQGSAGAGVGAGLGGRGALVTGTLAVTPLSTLNVFVGGAPTAMLNGFNGGASGGDATAGRGGGASDIRVGGLAEANRVVTAGGGGGGGNIGCFGNSIFGGVGGAGGGGAGVQGTNSAAGGGGFGGTAGTGGSFGIGCAPFQGQAGLSTTTGTGGAGGLGTGLCTPQPTSGGGGGGGFLGGGGGGAGAAGTVGCQFNDTGAGGGGAGGTSNAATLTSVTLLQGVNAGNGAVELCFVLPPFLFGDGFE